jgi:large conductance mechanosensitive channel
MLKEFKEFALKGNMVDLAIGVVIGSAFGGLVNSIVADFITPIIGFLTGGLDFSNMFIQLAGEPKPTLGAAREAGATIAYGHFLTLLINFLIVAAVLFAVVKLMNGLKRKEEAAPAKAPEPSREEVLLTEIRDLLAARGK